MVNFPGKYRKIIYGVVLMTCMSGMSLSSASTHALNDSDYLGREDVDAFIDEMVEEHNFSRKELESIISKAERSDRALELISKPAEKAMPWGEYREIFITPDRIAKGVSFWEENAETLAQVEKNLGVPAHVIVAIIGVETYYGRQTGGFKVLDALTTLGFDFPRRGSFFRKELKNFLILTREHDMNIDELTGSYAGAMGIPQFMPSSFLSYAVDFTGDNQANIWKSDDDAIASVGNYLKKHGWRYGSGIAMQATASNVTSDEVVSSGLKPNKKLSLLQKAGWDIPKPVPKSTKVLAMRHEGNNGSEYWIGLHNFYVITRYNRSQMYALAVYQLAKEVQESYSRSFG